MGVPSFLADFEIIPIEAVRGQIYGGMGAGVRGRSPLLGEGIRGSVRLGRLGIEMWHGIVVRVTYENAENETRKKCRNGKFRITLNCRKLFGTLR
jgi:hypothetical protein